MKAISNIYLKALRMIQIVVLLSVIATFDIHNSKQNNLISLLALLYYCSIVLLRCMRNAFDIGIEQKFLMAQARCIIFERRPLCLHACEDKCYKS